MKKIKYITFPIPEDKHFTFSNKCRFHDITMQEVLAFLVGKFLEGEFDEELNLK